VTAAKEFLEGCLEVVVDLRKRFLKFLARDFVDLANRPVVFSIDEMRSLRCVSRNVCRSALLISSSAIIFTGPMASSLPRISR